MRDDKAESEEKSNLLPDENSPGLGTHQAILQNETENLSTISANVSAQTCVGGRAWPWLRARG